MSILPDITLISFIVWMVSAVALTMSITPEQNELIESSRDMDNDTFQDMIYAMYSTPQKLLQLAGSLSFVAFFIAGTISAIMLIARFI